MATTDLLRLLRTHPLTSELRIVDARKNEHGTPAFAGILNHHTASAPPRVMPSLSICQNGRGGSAPVPGPLCNLLGGRDGSIAVISSGVANHAGKGDPAVLARARSGTRPSARPGPDRSNAGGNTGFLGIEWENNGTGEEWSPALLDSMYRVNAALCDHFGWDPFVAVLQHYLWTLRKIDCAFISPRLTYLDFQHGVAGLLGTPTPAPPAPDPKEWDEMATEAQVEAAAKRGALAALKEHEVATRTDLLTVLIGITGSKVASLRDKVTNLGDIVNKLGR